MESGESTSVNLEQFTASLRRERLCCVCSKSVRGSSVWISCVNHRCVCVREHLCKLETERSSASSMGGQVSGW